MMNVFHAGDGNLHPLIVFDGREPGVWERVYEPATRSSRRASPRAACCRASTASGSRSASAMPLVFTRRRPRRPGAAARRVRPRGSRQPAEGAPEREPLRRAATGARRARGSDGRHRPRSTSWPSTVARGGRRRRRSARGTQWEVGNPPRPTATEVRAPAGVIAYEPADLTVTVGAGTTVAELAEVLGEHAQECALDPRIRPGDGRRHARVRACPGIRRLRHGPLRDRVLEVRFVTADGELVKGGGPDGQERERLRHPTAARRVASAPSACSCRSRCGASPSTA